ncbi:MAG: LytR C-terminal domain-containing protein, partial [Candidatus Saccharibacteria bacterium]
QIQAFIDKQLNANDVTREAANVVVLNGSGVIGVGQTEADKLEKQGFTISLVDTAPAAKYADVEIYQIGTGKTATAAKLKELFNIKTIKTTTPPTTVSGDTNFVVIFGKSRSSNN